MLRRDVARVAVLQHVGCEARHGIEIVDTVVARIQIDEIDSELQAREIRDAATCDVQRGELRQFALVEGVQGVAAQGLIDRRTQIGVRHADHGLLGGKVLRHACCQRTHGKRRGVDVTAPTAISRLLDCETGEQG